MDTFQVSILAADSVFYEGPCQSLVVPTVNGQRGIWAHHRNLIIGVVPGTLKYKIPDQPEQIAAVSSGLIKIENNTVLILVDSAERPEDIDANRAQREADEAREELLQKQSRQEYRFSQTKLARALNRLKIKNGTWGGTT